MDAQHSASTIILTLIQLLLLISAQDSLFPGSSISVEHSSDVLRSQDGTFTCGFQNISYNAAVFAIWFSNSAAKTIVWSANQGHPVYTWRSRVELDSRGIMVVKDYNGQTVWTNNVNSSDADRAQLLDTGNLVIKGKGDVILWQSFDSPTDTLLPNQNIIVATKLVSTQTLLVPGQYSFHFDDEHILTLFDDEKDVSFIYWPNPNINIWLKQRKSFNSTTIGVLDSSGHFLGSDNLSFTAADSGLGIMRRLTLDYDGNLRLYSMEKKGTWMITWMAYSGLCYVRGLCGVNGMCVYAPAPTCTCAPGYEAVNPRDGRQGCKAKFRIRCDKRQNMKFVKLPHSDFLGHDQDVHKSVSLSTCKNICMSACSCMGFSYWQGSGSCYMKNAIVSGLTCPNYPGSVYIKLPKDVNVPESSIPQSKPFGSEFVSECSTLTANVTVSFLDMIDGSYSGPRYWYAYGFLSAIFLVEVTFVVSGWWFILRREGRQLRGVWPAEVGYEMITSHFRRYTYKELQRATRLFTDEIGRGASGIVYRGVLKDKRVVAVKRLADIHQGEAQFQHELSVIGRIYHMNLVRIWGFCAEGPHNILVTEFVENGSLATSLFCTKGSPLLLEWKQRFKIALGVAKGLAYLHHECLEWVIHCDVKPENILLDENLEPKIIDFGLAKLQNRDGSSKNVSRIHGTRGYIAPEWVSSLPITAKVDVYSFGVVLLELLKGVRVSQWPANENEEVEMVLARTIRMLEENEKMYINEQSWIAGVIDSRLNGQFNSLQAQTMIKVAVSCVQEDKSRRPNMENVVRMLLSVDEAGSIMQHYSLS